MKMIMYLFFASSLLACGTSKDFKIDNISIEPEELRVVDQKFNVAITITNFKPYCGGAAPDRYTLSQQSQLQRQTSFVLIELTTQAKMKVATDSSGILRLNLPIGKYVIKEVYKDCTFEEFLAQNKAESSEYFETREYPDCYEKWWKDNLGEFEILPYAPLQELHFQSYEACFTGINPCLIYTGPKPP